MSTVLKTYADRRRFVQLLGAGLILPCVAEAAGVADASGIGRPPAALTAHSGSNARAGSVIDPSLHGITRIHQILIVDGFATPKKISSILTSSMASLKSFYPEAKYTLWNGDALRSFIVDKFGREVTQAFDRLKPYAYKADLGRYCLLYEGGGLYSDVALAHEQQLRIPTNRGFAAFREPFPWMDDPGGVTNSLLWAKPKRPEMELIINKVLAHCRDRFYGRSSLDPTGPWLLGKVCAAVATDQWRSGSDNDQYIGICSDPRRGEPIHFQTCESEPRRVAFRIPRTGSDWSIFNMKGVNNYTHMWQRKDVYVSAI